MKCACPKVKSKWTLIPFLLTFISCFLSLTVVLTCHFVTVKASDNRRGDFGLFRYHKDNESCKRYGWSDSWKYFDSTFNAARSCAFITTVMGFVAIVFYLCTLKRSKPYNSLRCLSCFAFLGFVGQALTFLVFASDSCQSDFSYIAGDDVEDCDMAWGANVSLGACLSWLAASVMSCPIARYYRQRSEEESGMDGTASKRGSGLEISGTGSDTSGSQSVNNSFTTGEVNTFTTGEANYGFP